MNKESYPISRDPANCKINGQECILLEKFGRYSSAQCLLVDRPIREVRLCDTGPLQKIPRIIPT